MPDKWIGILANVPFLLMTKDNGKGKISPNWTRIVEIIAAIVIILWYMSHGMAKIETQIELMNKKVDTLDDRVYQHMVDTYDEQMKKH